MEHRHGAVGLAGVGQLARVSLSPSTRASAACVSEPLVPTRTRLRDRKPLPEVATLDLMRLALAVPMGAGVTTSVPVDGEAMVSPSFSRMVSGRV